MGIKETLEAINAMEANGVIERYSIAVAVAAWRAFCARTGVSDPCTNS
jgi:hypothetical protein